MSLRVARVRSALWLVPLLCVLGGGVLSAATIAVDRRHDHALVPRNLTGGPSSVQTILSTIATSTVTLGSLVLTVTTVAVQLAMGQFSPRIVTALLNDRWSQLAFGLFGATFIYSLLVLREVDDQAGGVVPGLSVVVSVVLMLASIASLFLFVQHAGGLLRAAGLIDLVGDRTMRARRAAQQELTDRTVAARRFLEQRPLLSWWGGRDMWLFDGPVAAVASIGVTEAAISGGGLRRRSPQWWWPEDRAWFIASEIDDPWTFVAGSAELDVVRCSRWKVRVSRRVGGVRRRLLSGRAR